MEGIPLFAGNAEKGGKNSTDLIVNSVVPSDEKLARQVKLYLCHRYSGNRLREIGERYGVSESGATQASRRMQIKQKNDKKLAELITKMVKELALSNV